MSNKTLVVTLAVLSAVVVGLIVLLVTGGDDTPTGFQDAGNDVSVAGAKPTPENPLLADITDASVYEKDDTVVFEVVLGSTIPAEMPGGAFDIRWDVLVDGRPAWIVGANLDVGLNASILAQQTDYGSSTIDDTMPGEVAVDGDTLTITLRTSEIPDWPESFDWTLTTKLDADRTKESSAIAEDAAPDSGAGHFGD